ncbi:ubiquitin-conjugating enzyme E2 [Mrakia frigida]|uniref:ubiquitin-conjugating enzyme E2 n=1 Tax=Mrakia frigida TaxID=29902 RepID=UPI003FCC0969
MSSINSPPTSAPPSSSKTSAAQTGPSSSGSVTKRLRSELMGLMMASVPGISAFPESDASLYEWRGSIAGPEATPYAGLTFKITLHFPSNYPYTAPTIKFVTPCFHPNVALPGGDICLDILKEKWSAVYSVQTILVSLQSLLGEPNNDSPLNVEAADLWDNQEAFKAQVASVYRVL